MGRENEEKKNILFYYRNPMISSKNVYFLILGASRICAAFGPHASLAQTVWSSQYIFKFTNGIFLEYLYILYLY